MSDVWRTPNFIFNQLNSIFNFTVDAAATEENKKCANFFKDGLGSGWGNNRVFCNPPFSKKDQWIIKAHNEVQNNCPLCVMILPLNCMSSSVFFDTIIKNGYRTEILRQRISFLDENNNPINGNNTGTVIVYFMKSIKSRE